MEIFGTWWNENLAAFIEKEGCLIETDVDHEIVRVIAWWDEDLLSFMHNGLVERCNLDEHGEVYHNGNNWGSLAGKKLIF